MNKFLQVGGKDAHDSVPRAYGRAGYDVPVWRVAHARNDHKILKLFLRS